MPTGSATVLVTSFTYGAAGFLETTTDPAGIVTKQYTDALGRTTKTVANYTGSAETASSDVATEYIYDGAGHVLTVQADEPGGGYQRTQYVYGVTTSGGSAVTSNDLLAAVQHPDPSTGAPSSSQQESYLVNALGQVTQYTDQNGNVHQYTYDVLGRLTIDAVTTLGSGVDGAVRRIEYAYDAQGNLSTITSYDAATGGNVVNQVLRQYNGLGQLAAEYQEHGGAVNTSTSLKVQYAYTEMSGGVNNSRLTSITYPSGYVVNFNYGTAGSLNDTISRLDSMSDNGGTLESYKYLGLSTVVERDHPQTGVNLTYVSQSSSTGDAGDKYFGLDRFGRVVDQNWYNTGTSSSVDEFGYGYDRDGNRTYRENLVDAVFSELYSYDNVDQLSSFQRGTLNSTKDGISGTPTASQSWNLDALGNWTSVTTNGTTQTRTANQQNEYTAVGSATPTYDANGNLATDENGHQYRYDAWNRLIQVKDASNNVLASYTYDGLGRRISETHGTTTTALYLSTQGQVLEERVAGSTTVRYVWSPVYVNALVLRDRDTNGDGTLDERLYVTQDANWNVTGLVSTSGSVVERYTYTPFGAASLYAGDWSTRTSTNYGWLYLFQGERYDWSTGQYHAGARDYSPTLGRWAQRDPLGRTGSANNLYVAMGNDPNIYVDPTGEFFWIPFIIGAILVGGGTGGLYYTGTQYDNASAILANPPSPANDAAFAGQLQYAQWCQAGSYTAVYTGGLGMMPGAVIGYPLGALAATGTAGTATVYGIGAVGVGVAGYQTYNMNWSALNGPQTFEAIGTTWGPVAGGVAGGWNAFQAGYGAGLAGGGPYSGGNGMPPNGGCDPGPAPGTSFWVRVGPDGTTIIGGVNLPGHEGTFFPLPPLPPGAPFPPGPSPN